MTPGLETWIASGRLIDLILVLVAVEAIVLVVLRARGFLRIGTLELIAMLAAGAFLMLALRGALLGADAGWIAACLFGALVAHLADLWLRERRR